MLNNNGYKLLTLFGFILIGSVLVFFSGNDLHNYIQAFIISSVTIATFSISFSFLQYQFTPYKSLLDSISIKQIVYSFVTVLLALVPIFALVIDVNLAPKFSLFVIPILTYMLIFLLVLSQEETNPILLLKKKIEEEKLKNYLEEYEKRKDKKYSDLKKLKFSKPDETPMHDFGESKYQSIVTENNPFDFANEVLEATIINSDISRFEKSLDLYVKLIEKILTLSIEKEQEFKFEVNKLIQNSFDRLTIALTEYSAVKKFQNIFLEKFGVFLKKQALQQNQTNDLNTKLISKLNDFAINILNQKNHDGALFIVSLNRELAQKGIYDLQKIEDDKFLEIHLPIFPDNIKRIGQESIKLKNSDFLFRCLEEIGYMGCTAIKNDNYHVGIESLQTLVQLGREARANNIKCFWRHCLLDAVDHADERIWWMLSWVWRLDSKSQEKWIESFETAYSRLNGYGRTIELNVEDGNPVFNFSDSDEPYKEGFSKDRYSKTIDYSDFQVTKEFKLY